MPKKPSFSVGDLVRLKGDTGRRLHRITKFIDDRGYPRQAILVVEDTQVERCPFDLTELVPVLQEAPQSRSRQLKSEPGEQPLTMDGTTVPSKSRRTTGNPAIEGDLPESGQETLQTEDDSHIAAGTQDLNPSRGSVLAPAGMARSGNAPQLPVEHLEQLTKLLTHLQTEAGQTIQSSSKSFDPRANTTYLVTTIGQTFDAMWDDIKRRLRKEMDEARIHRETTRDYKSQVEGLTGTNRLLDAQVLSLRSKLQHLESDLTDQDQAAQQLERQVQLERHGWDRRRSVSIGAFWRAREDFYRGLHRGILAEQSANRKRLKNFRHQSLCADMELITQFGGALDLYEESLRFDRCHYDGSLYHWYDEDEEPVPNGTPATVFLPGWQIGDVRVKACLGRKVVDLG